MVIEKADEYDHSPVGAWRRGTRDLKPYKALCRAPEISKTLVFTANQGTAVNYGDSVDIVIGSFSPDRVNVETSSTATVSIAAADQ